MRLRTVALSAGLVAAAALVGGALAWYSLVHVEPPELPPLAGALQRGSLRVGALERSYALYRPKSLSPRAPLVIVLHGSMGSGEQARAGTFYAFDALADREGFAVAYPDGFEGHWNDCRREAPYSAKRRRIDDVGFLRALVARLADDPGIDPARVFATGISNGGQMAYRLALEAPELVAAIAPVAAGLPTDENLDCAKSGVAKPVLVVNGTADPMNPFYGGRVALYGLWGDRGTVLSSDDTVAYWAGLAGHRLPSRRTRYEDRSTDDGSWAELDVWDGAPGPEVAHLVIHDGGHTFPHPKYRYPRFLGATNADVDGAAEVWSFFARQTR